MSKVIVMGGSRGIGLETVKELLKRGHNVVAFSRNAGRISLSDLALTKVSGDATNEEDVRAALNGVDAVVQALGAPVDLKILTGPIDLFSSATQVLIPVMTDMKIKRLITVTGFGAGDSEASINCLQKIPFNIVFGHAYRDKSKQEELIKSSTLDWTIVRPSVLTNLRLPRPYKIRLSASEWRNGLISRYAVADYIASAIEDPNTIGAEPVLTY